MAGPLGLRIFFLPVDLALWARLLERMALWAGNAGKLSTEFFSAKQRCQRLLCRQARFIQAHNGASAEKTFAVRGTELERKSAQRRHVTFESILFGRCCDRSQSPARQAGPTDQPLSSADFAGF